MLSNQLINAPLNVQREDLSDILRGKIIQLDEIIKVTEALKNTDSADKMVDKIYEKAHSAQRS